MGTYQTIVSVRDKERECTTMAKFEIYKDTAKQHRWRLRSANNQVIASSGESFTTKDGCKNGIAAVKRDSPTASTEDQTGEQ